MTGREAGQRDRLLGRSRPRVPYRMLIDPDGAEQARKRLAEAQSAARRTRVVGQGDQAAREQADRDVEAAQAALDACHETIMLHALPPEEVEELVAAHPPTGEQMAAVKAERDKARQRGDQPPDWPAWNDDTFRPALLAAATPESGMSADDWATFLASNVSAGEARDLWRTCLAVQQAARVADPVVLPKGLMGMLNSL